MITEKFLSYDIISETTQIEDTKKKHITLKISDNKSMYIIHRALIQQLQNNRQKKANTKTRSEVKGGGRKPWKQKGSGKARAGSIRSPLWRGGGVIFGPKTQKHNIKINKKEKQLALRTLLYNKFNDTIIVSHYFEICNKPSTKYILQKIYTLGIDIMKNKKILIITHSQNTNLYLSIRNLKNIQLINVNQIHILALLKAEKIIMTTNALEKINEIYNA